MSLASGSSVPLTIKLSSAFVGFPKITNTASVASSTPDPNPANNRQSVTTLLLDTTTADLSITLSSSPEPVPLGAPLLLTATVTNGGPSDATNVAVTYTPPSAPQPTGNINLTSAMPSQGSCAQPGGPCSLGTLARGFRATITFLGTPAVAGTLTSTATVTADQPDPDQSNNTAMTNTTAQ